MFLITDIIVHGITNVEVIYNIYLVKLFAVPTVIKENVNKLMGA